MNADELAEWLATPFNSDPIIEINRSGTGFRAECTDQVLNDRKTYSIHIRRLINDKPFSHVGIFLEVVNDISDHYKLAVAIIEQLNFPGQFRVERDGPNDFRIVSI